MEPIESSKFISRIIHDLRSPLNNIVLFTRLIVKRDPCERDGKIKEYVTYIDFATSRMSGLIDRLQEYFKITLECDGPCTVDCNQALEAAVAGLRKVLRESGAEITHATLPSIQINPAESVILFRHLIDNAIKYRSESIPKIHIDVKSSASGWIFSITDNGRGIRPEETNSIFEPFVRGDGSDSVVGSGFGLTLARIIVEKYGGKIWVETNQGPGSGSNFCFRLPLSLPD